jgi:uncharacterized lipoprotein YajG
LQALKIVAVSALAMLTAACSTTAVSLRYDPSTLAATAPKGPAVVGLTVVDNRQLDPKHLGAIRGGMGQSLKTLELDHPVGDVVRDAVLAGLTARGLAATDKPKFQMIVTVDKLDCSQLVRREAHVLLQVQVVDLSGAHPPYARTVQANVVDGGSLTDTGILASTDDLRKTANDALQKAVDQLFDDQVFRSELG